MLDEYSTRSSEATIDILNNEYTITNDTHIEDTVFNTDKNKNKNNDIENNCKDIERINNEFITNPLHKYNNLHSDGLNIDLNSDPNAMAGCYFCTLCVIFLMCVTFVLYI
jgi:hypothetical protein